MHGLVVLLSVRLGHAEGTVQPRPHDAREDQILETHLLQQGGGVFDPRQQVHRVVPIRAEREAPQAVAAVYAHHGGRIACASGADLFKVQLQLEKTGILRWFEGRIFSGHDLPRSKPHPDVYLAAAAALSADPRRCAVVEDTVTGVTAGVAAGATVFGYSPPELGHDAPAALRAAGAVTVFTHMAHLPRLLATWV